MEMTNAEIVKSYREARDRRKQISILADLNLCTVDEIKGILLDGGINWRELPRCKRQVKQSPPLTQNKAQDKQLAEDSSLLRHTIIVDALEQYRKSVQAEREKACAGFDEALHEIDQILNELK